MPEIAEPGELLGQLTEAEHDRWLELLAVADAAKAAPGRVDFPELVDCIRSQYRLCRDVHTRLCLSATQDWRVVPETGAVLACGDHRAYAQEDC